MASFFRRKKETPEAVEEASEAAVESEAEPDEDGTSLDQAVERTRRGWFGRIGGIFRRGGLDDEIWDELEETLIGADAGVQTTTRILEDLRERVRKEGIRDPGPAPEAAK